MAQRRGLRHLHEWRRRVSVGRGSWFCTELVQNQIGAGTGRGRGRPGAVLSFDRLRMNGKSVNASRQEPVRLLIRLTGSAVFPEGTHFPLTVRPEPVEGRHGAPRCEWQRSTPRHPTRTTRIPQFSPRSSPNRHANEHSADTGLSYAGRYAAGRCATCPFPVARPRVRVAAC